MIDRYTTFLDVAHKEQASMIRRYIAWRNRHKDNRRLREIVNKAKVA